MSDQNPNPGAGGGNDIPAAGPSRPESQAQFNQSRRPDIAEIFDTIDERDNGIAEVDRVPLGQDLKALADQEGVSVRQGLGTLTSQYARKRYGTAEEQRAAIGEEIDAFGIMPTPDQRMAMEAEYGEPSGQAPAHGVPHSVALAAGEFVQSNPEGESIIEQTPALQDPDIQQRMAVVAQDM